MNQIGNKRIESIDALRAFALLGILVVHISQLYNYTFNETNDFSYFSSVGLYMIDFIYKYFNGRFVILFSILFGMSFYLILRNPNYSVKKFIWRCVLLMLFGLFNKLFYTTDILLWYGVNGLILAILPIRKLSPMALLSISFLLFLMSYVPFLDITRYFDYSGAFYHRYVVGEGLQGIISYPYLHVLFDDFFLFWGNTTSTLSYFVFGYFIGRSGLANRLDQVISLKSVSLFIIVTLLVFGLYRLLDYPSPLKKVYYLASALLYANLFLYTFSKLRDSMTIMTSFGRLGLTNYSVQNIFFPIVLSTFLLPMQLSFECIFVISLLFYCIQIYYSNEWLKVYRFGPMEYIWRVLTNFQYVSNRHNLSACDDRRNYNAHERVDK